MRFVSTAVLASALAIGIVSFNVQQSAAQEMMSSKLPEGLYVSGGVGASFPRDADLSNSAGSVTVEMDPGYGVGFALGNAYDNNWRTELELGYRSSDVDNVSGTSVSGDVDALSLMVNALHDFPTESAWTPYLGLGVGGVRISGTFNATTSLGSATIKDTDTTLAYQGLAGISYRIDDRLSFYTDYRYFAAVDPDFKEDGVSADGEYAEHRIMVGLRWSFGAPKKMAAPMTQPVAAQVQQPAPPPTPAPQPQPAPAAAAPAPAPDVPRTYLVFFDWDRADLRPDALAILGDVVANYPKASVVRIDATGHADRSGPDRYNMGLSQRRAQAVTAALIRQGIPVADIRVDWKGEREPLVQTPDGVREPQNRRVEIVFR